MKITQLFAVLFVLVAAFPAFAEEERGTKEEAIAMAKKVVEMYNKDGEEATFTAVTAGQLNTKDLYPFIYDLNCFNRAHGKKPELVGKDLSALRDGMADGKFYIKEMADLAKSGKPGWVDYKWPDPITKEVDDKSSYILPLGANHFVGVGVYLTK